MIAISAKDLTRSFGNKTAVDGINIDVEEGEIYGFLGPNGAGKSTTVRMLVTLLKPTSGDATILGHSVTKNPTAVRFQIGVALQETALDGQQTGVEFLRLQGRLYGLNTSEIDSRLKDLRSLIDIGDDLNKPIRSYSGGMKRRVDLAAALVHNPSVLFLDEPTTGLDPISRKKVWDEVGRLNQVLGMTIFLTTQYLEEADQLADRIAIISGGRLAVEGTPKQLKQDIGNDLIVVEPAGSIESAAQTIRSMEGIDSVDIRGNEMTISSPFGSQVLGDVASALNHLGANPRQMVLRTPTLDDVFLKATGNSLLQRNEEA